MLVDFENTGFINVHPSLCEEKDRYIPWGYIKGDIAEQSDLMDLLANIEGGLTAEQISLLVNADDRLDSVERDIAALETSHELDITHINTEISKKANIVDVYTKSEIDSKNYLTEHQSLTGYATESWVYGKGYISTETDPIWNAEKHKYAQKSELPNMMGYAKENWVSEQLLAKANAVDVYTKIEIEGKEYASKDWTAEQLLAKVNATDTYTKDEIDNILANINVDSSGCATKSWVKEQGYLTEHQSLANYYTKSEVDSAVNNKVDINKIWSGTQDEWDNLSVEQQNSYIIAMIQQ